MSDLFELENNNTDELVGKIVQASSLESKGEIAQAIALYQEIAQQDPSGNYGDVAREALNNLQDGSTSENRDIISPVEAKVSYGLWDRFNLRSRTTLILIGISAFSTIAVSSIAYKFANGSMTEQITLAEQKAAVQVADKVAFYMRERFGDIQIMSNLTILTNPELRSRTNFKDKQAALDSFIKAYTIYDSLAFFDLNGDVISQSTGTPLKNHSSRSYFQAAIKENKPVLSQPILSKSSGIMAVYLAAPVKDSTTGKNIGVIRARMPVSYLRDVILSENRENNYLLDDQGQIFAASNQQEFERIQNLPEKTQPASSLFSFFDRLQQSSTNQTIVSDRELVSYIPFSEFEDEFRSQLPDLGWSTMTTIDKEIAFTAQRQLLLSFAIGTILITAVVAAIASIVGLKATQPLLQAAQAVKKLGQGNFDVRVPVSGRDELADLGNNINKMAGQIQDLLHTQEAEAKSQRQEKEKLQHGVMGLLLDVEGAKQGDLTVRANITDGVVGSIADAFNSTLKKLQILLQEVQQVSSEVGELSQAGEGSVRQLSKSALIQAAEIDKALISIDEINESVKSIADYAQEAAKIARDGSIQAKEGDLAMDATVDSIEKIRTTVANTSKKVKQLAESSQEIAQIVAIISGISEKTNLLAFNASVEAARAGEHGEGFRIVAEEVRRLADRITEATKDIQQLVTAIQQDTTLVLQGMESSTSEVVNGSELVRMTKLNLQSLAQTSQQIDRYLKSISTNTAKQTDDSKQVNEKINSIALVAKNTSDEAENVVQSLQTLVQEAQTLQASVSQFKL
ncbi:HAMP domain-containing protein [Waterburya agarophytonicola K14]|uniref:HAMP domain-containing protein n=1 Tax=Waterburya agarophytonicola KI4 TaxID=2874699 RepID=A0A964BR92_9CYAN|nr:methyl-accepting chemotaxis protein [Waterburya agarophytonicola]MCC0176360.1 HAMP domain-containing protein [Waterburya agarophytonicola KI4]